MAYLLVGFDSAWTRTNSGALVGCVLQEDGKLHELGPPKPANYDVAAADILEWQDAWHPVTTLILLDQPTIVENSTGQRPVENIIAAPICRRHSAVQPANTSRKEMFGSGAPVWDFLNLFGGAADPLALVGHTLILETYPVLATIALGWTLPGPRPNGRVLKYNPQRRKTFSMSDWQHLCGLVSGAFLPRGLSQVATWIDAAAQEARPRKVDQDKLDACLCLLVALWLVEQHDSLLVGNLDTGYVVVPHNAELAEELAARCTETGRVPADWVRVFQLQIST